MVNPTILQNVNTPLFLGLQMFEDQTILANENPVAGQVMGTITAGAVSTVADGGNTGDGTVSGDALAAGGPAKVGVWNLECVAAAVDSGTFKLIDPDGIEVASNITVGVLFTGAGLTFTINDGATDFIVGDKFAITVAAGSGYLKKCVSTAVDGSEIPKYVMSQDVTNTTDAVKSVCKRARVEAGKLIFEGADTLATLVHGKSMKDWLHERGIYTKEASHLDFPDNS